MDILYEPVAGIYCLMNVSRLEACDLILLSKAITVEDQYRKYPRREQEDSIITFNGISINLSKLSSVKLEIWRLVINIELLDRYEEVSDPNKIALNPVCVKPNETPIEKFRNISRRLLDSNI
jgi:hypothetical protein